MQHLEKFAPGQAIGFFSFLHAWHAVAICKAPKKKLDPDYPESIQFPVSKGRVSGNVLSASVVVRWGCGGARARCRLCGVCEWR